MPEPKKNPKKTKKKELSVTAVPSLSSSPVEESVKRTPKSLDEIKKQLFNSINNEELVKGLDKWDKENQLDNKIALRDLNVLKSIITEYLDAYIVLGYNTESERIVIHHYKNSRDKDAIMEFLKTIFIQSQQNNFLD
jgi:hypothetical protein